MSEIDFIQPKKTVGELVSVDVLDKIRAEIEQVAKDESRYDKKWAKGLKYALKIIDKYKEK